MKKKKKKREAEHTLLLMRHAKSSWKDTSLSDRERPLNKRGLHDAPMMGKRLKRRGYHCDKLISSPAKRARQTAVLVASEIGYDGDIIKDEALYMADIRDYLEVIASVDEKIDDLMLVSHNPGTEALFEYLTGKSVENLPTSAYALIAITGSWSEITSARLIQYDLPKSTQER